MLIDRASTRPAWWRPVVTAFRLGTRRVRLEPGGLVFAGVFYVMVTTVLAGLWRTAAEAAGGEIVGYGATALVWYVATSEASVISLPQRLIEDVGIEIEDGYETELLRPVSPLAVRVAAEVGKLLPRLAVCAVIGVALASLLGGPPPNGAALALAAPSLVLATTLNLVAQHGFAGAAFWIRDARSTWFLYQKLVFVVGGMLLPLQILPGWLELVARILPFAAMAYAPARLASGHLEPELLLIQVGWLIVIGAVTNRIFLAGERRIAHT